MIIAVAAMGHNRVIGQDGRIPWKMPADLRHFRAVTQGGTVLMGRRTWESLGRALPDRENLVLTRSTDFQPEGARAVTLEEALALKDVFIIGGEDVYRLFLPHFDRQVLTEIHATFEGDTFYPEFSKTEWHEVERVDHEADADNPYPYSFVTWARNR